MTHQALCRLVSHGLKFNEANGKNPFAYLTTLITNEFIQFNEKEKKQRELKHELMEEECIDGYNQSKINKQAKDWESLNQGLL